MEMNGKGIKPKLGSVIEYCEVGWKGCEDGDVGLE